ncbi:MAG: hypothetical protein QG635_1528 [Bacteroidota bacterium]|nr:hypothetical protein [Bacteroidota bacterium]
MKNLLIIAYYFPPSGGPGVQRVLKHVKYLHEFGWQPIVLTVSNGQFPARDESLLKEIPDSVIVRRSRIYEPYDIYRFLTRKKKGMAIDVNVIKKESQKIKFNEKVAEFVRSTFFIPDARIGWLPSAVKEASKIIKQYHIDALYSSSPPYTCSVIARKIKRRNKLPWVAGFRDPWTEFLTSPRRWLLPAKIDRRLEYSVFKEANAVECAWEGIKKDALRKFPSLNAFKFHYIPNGFDSADFPKVEPVKNDKFTLTYSGSLYGRRNPESLFTAIEQLIRDGRINPARICLRFVGRFGAEVEEMFSKASFRNSIETISYIPHSESIALLMRSDALLLIVDEAKESEEIVPGKVYEYVGVGKPILAIAPQRSAIADLMRETACGKLAHQSEIDKIGEIFLQYYKEWESGGIRFNPVKQAVDSYERRNAAKRLAALLDEIV